MGAAPGLRQFANPVGELAKYPAGRQDTGYVQWKKMWRRAGPVYGVDPGGP